MSFLNRTISNYRFIEFINEGGFGAVYKAVKNDCFYAIKVFREAYVLREFREHGDKNRIKREIDIMKSVSDGKNLQQLLNGNGKIGEQRALDIFRKVIEGINHLHNSRGDDDVGIIHRDLKPANILIKNDGSIKIVDFGISKIIDFTSITSTGEIFGTGPYMSPEQITDSKHIDKRSDYYTLGVILYEMLTGVFPYDFQYSPELLEKIKNDPAIPPRRRNAIISNKIENVILKLLEKNPYQRYAGICIKADSLKDEKNRKYLLNIFSSFDCDGFMIYADCIDNNTSELILYQYLKFLHELEKWTKKPVIAGRVNLGIGIGLLSFEIAGFTCGTARFESFYEGLYKDRQDTYNMGIRYYFRELLTTVYIKRSEPTRFEKITEILGMCDCIFCRGKTTVEAIKDQNTKLHFLENTKQEIEQAKSLPPKERLDLFIKRIDIAYSHFTDLREVFKPDDYAFLGRWKNIFTKLKEEYYV